MLPAPSRPWWSPSVLSRSSSSNKQQPQASKLSASKKFSTIATAIGLRLKKSATPVQEPSSPILPLHTPDIESPRPTKQAIKPVSVTVGWTDPQHEDFVDTYPPSIFSSPDLDPFAAAKYPGGPPDPSESLHFSTFPELESRVRRDTPYAHNRMSCTSSSTLSHQGSGITSDSSAASSPLLSPIITGRHLSRLTVDTGRLGRELFPSSPVSSQSIQRDWDGRSPIVASPSSATLRDVSGRGTTAPRSRIQSSEFSDAGPSTLSGADPLARKVPSACTLNGAPGPRVIIRQPSSSRSHPLQPPTCPPASELPPAPEGVQREDFSLLPAFSERTAHSAASSSSSLSFASSASSRFDALGAEGHRRDMRRLKHGKKVVRSRPPTPSKDASQDPPSNPSSSRREFSPTRTLKKAISIQNLPKKSQTSSMPSSLPAAEDTKPLKKRRSFHHSLVPVPPLPASLKQEGSSTLPSGRDALSVPEERKASVQVSQRSPLSSPVLNPMHVRRRLFSGTSLRRSTSSQTPEPEDDIQSILSLSPTTSPLARPHTAIPLHEPSVSNNPELSSFWDEAFPCSPTPGHESREHARKHILSAADILKFENMVRDGENLNGFERSRGNSFASLATSKQSVRTTPSSATSVRSFSPPSAMRHSESLGETSGKYPPSSRPRTRGISLQGKLGDVMDGRPQIAVPFPGQTMRTVSFQSLSALHGLPLPPRIHARPTTSSGTSSPSAENPPLLAAGDRSSFVITPLSPPPVRRCATRPTLDSPAPTPALRPGISRRPSFLDMRDDADQEPPSPPPLEDSFLDMGKASLDTVRSSMEEDPVLS